MIFALSADDRTLMVFPDEDAAISYCEGFDVAQAGWLFFAADGGALEPVFSEPASEPWVIISHGRYSLRPAPSKSRANLSAVLPSVAAVEGVAAVRTIVDVERLITLVRTDAHEAAHRSTRR